MLLNGLPGRKVILKGNHDYWWDTVSKMRKTFCAAGIENIEFIYNSCVNTEGMALCGTRGWCVPACADDRRIIAREAGRLERSLQCADPDCEPVAFLHYPPVYEDYCFEEIIAVLQKYGVKRCFYGHLHGSSIQHAVSGSRFGVEFCLVSADSLDFCPIKL